MAAYRITYRTNEASLRAVVVAASSVQSARAAVAAFPDCASVTKGDPDHGW